MTNEINRRYYGHLLNEFGGHCTECSATREQIEDGYHCGPVRCRECTLLRTCSGVPPICDECYQNMRKKPVLYGL